MRILIIAEYIAPVNEIAAIRWTKLGKYLNRDHECTVDILTTQKSFYNEDMTKTRYIYDKTIVSDLKNFNEIIEIPNTLLLRVLNFMLNITHSPKEKNTKQDIDKDSIKKEKKIPSFFSNLYSKAFLLSQNNAAKKIKKDWSKYDIVISSYGPYWPHWAALKIKKFNPSIIWIADYRDSLSVSNSDWTRKDIDFVRKVAKNANTVISVSKGTEISLSYQAKNNDTAVITNGYDEDELIARSRIKSQTFILSYTGTLYNMDDAIRDLKPLFSALEELIEDGSINAEDIEFCYCGDTEDEFQNQISDYKKIRWKNLGRIPRVEALNLQNRSSLLALCTWNTKDSQGILTGKIFEYLTSGVPIISLCSGNVPNSEMGEIIENSCAGFNYEEANKTTDYPEMKKYIKEKYDEWKNQGITVCNTNESYISRFSYRELASRLYQLF